VRWLEFEHCLIPNPTNAVGGSFILSLRKRLAGSASPKSHQQGRNRASYLGEALFPDPPSEPCLRLSPHTALQLVFVSDDIQDSFGYLHYAYLAIFVSDKPVSLRPVVGITPPLTTMETP
jgi:hypothetical protein